MMSNTMSERTQNGLSILIVTVGAGVLGDALGITTGWGINLVLWMSAVALAGWGLARRLRIELRGGGRGLLAVALAFAAGFAWRDSAVLHGGDFLAIVVAVSLLVMRGKAGRVRIAEISEYAQCLILSGFNAAFGPLLLLCADIEWRHIPRHSSLRHAIAIGRGLLIAVPLLLLFGGLFVAADAVFARMVSHAFSINADVLIAHLFGAAFLAWGVGGLLRATLLREEKPLTVIAGKPLLSLSIVEIGITLGLLDALFFAFVMVQVRYLFGGQSLVLATTGLTYAQYARQGFFQLVTVSALVLLLLLSAHWLLRKDALKTERIFHGLAGVQVALLFVIMASAVQRMRLYQSEYGLTELRLYTMAFMGWLSLVFVWFCATVLRERRERFVFGAMVSAFCVLGFLHVLNPDALIVKYNASLARQSKGFDAWYACSLSADAVPSLVGVLGDLPEAQRQRTKESLSYRWQGTSVDWRKWNAAKAQARRETEKILL